MLAAIALCVILGVLAVFQLALALGAPIGRFAWGGQHRVLPARLRIGSAIAIVIYAVIAVIALDRAGAIDVVSDVVSTVGMWVVFGYFVLGIPMNAVSRSRAERYTMTPIVVVLAVLSLVIALG
ncbi:hypothetical protein BJY17_003159 [Agromyces hippuratus]|uniref:Uncharacterized protein n=1 Tax=Agromyces hippuratus TaxID=286438 RepID=A0A852WVP9_9MICO|nr:hypothetical protein [Agromyces hippuratus]NYG22412.1 hypothetical protein [Agromyces hippuratus]